MDVSRLMILLKEAWSRVRDEGVGVMGDFIGKPFKALESGSTPRQMNGLVNLVASGNVVETKGALTEEHFLDALQKMWEHGAQGEYFSFVNANIKRMINDLAKNGANVRFLGDNGSMQNVLGIGVQKIVTDFGEISLVLDR